MPKPDKNISREKRKRHQRRAAIEPVIRHLKHDDRMVINYLKGVVGDVVNVMLAVAAFNFKRLMNIIKMKMSFGGQLYQKIFPCFLYFFIQKNKNHFLRTK
jgi:transposase, IS5 family